MVFDLLAGHPGPEPLGRMDAYRPEKLQTSSMKQIPCRRNVPEGTRDRFDNA